MFFGSNVVPGARLVRTNVLLDDCQDVIKLMLTDNICVVLDFSNSSYI